MILKEWSEAQDVYKATMARNGKAARSILALSKVKSYWYVWVAYLFFILSIVLFILVYIFHNPFDPRWWIDSFTWFIPLAALLLAAGAQETALAKEFAADYTTHAISHYPFWRRYTYFTYALFLHELRDRKYSLEKVVSLSKIAELATPPEEVSVRLSQNPIITYLMVVNIALLVNFITTSPLWVSEAKAAVLAIGTSLLGIAILGLSQWYPTANRRKNQHQRILRYLQWAERDMEEKTIFLTDGE